MLATPRTDRVRAGSTMWCSVSAKLTSDAATPMGTEKPKGNQPSCTLNTMSITRASQNVGVEASTRQ